MDDVITLRISNKHSITISRGDESKLTGKLKMCYNYAYAGPPDARASVYSIIMGPRPAHVPKEWIIDHADRNKSNNTRGNLRWVSPSFNAWNRVHGGKSRFRGVSLKKNKWCAQAMGAYFGLFVTEREAAIASATACVRTYGEWAESSDLLFTADQTSPGALLSLEELAIIKRSIAAADAPAPVSVTKGSGVYQMRNGKFRAVFRGKHLGTFKTSEAAVAFRVEHVKAVKEGEWQAYKSLKITRDDDGDAVIALSDGKHATGATSKVDDKFWHALTYKRTWYLNGDGYAQSSTVMLHKAVMLLINDKFESGLNASIDHIDPTAKLDNRAINLRVATHAEQQRNKAPLIGRTSIHVGVSAVGDRWIGHFSYTTSEGPQVYRTPRLKTEKEVVLLLNAKRLEVHGDKAILQRIPL
jgi:hypothetical protein